MSDQGVSGPNDLSRRDAIKRVAVTGGLVWAAPVIQSLAAPAFAQGGSPEACPAGRYFFKLGNNGTCEEPSSTGNQVCLGADYDATATFRCGTDPTLGIPDDTWTIPLEGPLVEGCLRCGGAANETLMLRFTNSGSGDYGSGTGTFVVSADRKTVTLTCTEDDGSPKNISHAEFVYDCT